LRGLKDKIPKGKGSIWARRRLGKGNLTGAAAAGFSVSFAGAAATGGGACSAGSLLPSGSSSLSAGASGSSREGVPLSASSTSSSSLLIFPIGSKLAGLLSANILKAWALSEGLTRLQRQVRV